MARQQTNEANDLQNTAASNAAGYGSAANGISNTLTPFLNQRLTNPQGFSQQDMGAMLANQLGSSGGSTSGITGQADLQQGRTRNNAGFATALGDAARQRTAANATASEGIAANNANLKQTQSTDAAHMLQGLYGTDVGAQSNQEGIQDQAIQAATDAQKVGWVQNTVGLGNTAANMAQAAASVMMASCPVAGSMYLMADGTERAVEELKTGDFVMGIDDEPQEIEEIESGIALAVSVKTENGLVATNSRTHAFALPRGGFVVATKSLGKKILTAFGPSKVISVEPAGEALVFNVITGGSHTYRSSGVWALGVGEAERPTSMEEWARRGELLEVV